jgi:hypothetical protein
MQIDDKEQLNQVMVDRSLQRLIGFDCRSLFDALSYFYPTF